MEKKTKTIKALRCVHMPAKDNTVIIFSSKHGKIYKAGFTIGNQDFTVVERENKEEAQWYCDMLEVAFKNLVLPKSLQNFKSEESRKLMADSLIPNIKIKNLR